MARNREQNRHCNHVIRIICEGEKTEPLFFTALCERYVTTKGIDARTVPQAPVTDETEELSTERGSYKGKKRQVKQLPAEDAPVISGAPPLKWVVYARRLLSEGVDEAWAVYDKDKHPKHKEAIEEAEKIVNGKRVGIAFTSRSFEYYLLLHFEYLFREFQETECGERVGGKKKIFRCGTDTFPDKDCHGDKCINGYARMHGYWEESKTSQSMFPLIENRLKKGIINGCRLRAESDAVTKEPMYNRNPYTTADLLVGRLMGIETINYGSTYSYIETGNNLSIVRSGSTLTVKNELSKIAILNDGFFQIYNWEEDSYTSLNDRIVLEANSTVSLDLSGVTANQLVSLKTSAKEILFLPSFG